MKRGGLISLTSRGLYCKQGDFYIDPWRPVAKAVVTHAHAYRVSGRYLVPAEVRALFEIRLDDGAKTSALRYGQATTVNGVKASFHPAGHILGLASQGLTRGEPASGSGNSGRSKVV